MPIESTVIQRFKQSVDYLLTSGIAATKKEIAASIDVSPSYFTEILKERITISADLIQIYLNEWPVNPLFLMYQSDEVGLDKDSSNKVDEGKGAKTSNAKIIALVHELKRNSISENERAELADQIITSVAELTDENSQLKTDLVTAYKMRKKSL